MVTIIKKGMPKEDIRKKIDQIISKGNKKNIMPLAGKLKTSIDPLEFQKKMRNEWE